jgi:hypothetical protein
MTDPPEDVDAETHSTIMPQGMSMLNAPADAAADDPAMPCEAGLTCATMAPSSECRLQGRIQVVAIIASVLSFVWWVVIVIAWIMFLMVTMAIARSKGRSPLFWGLLAVFFPLITIIILLLMPAHD